jgi:hypothetical protein
MVGVYGLCVELIVVMGFTVVCVVIGYLMGLKAARPDEKLITRQFDPGPPIEPEGDIWQDAMKAPEDMNERIKTV